MNQRPGAWRTSPEVHAEPVTCGGHIYRASREPDRLDGTATWMVFRDDTPVGFISSYACPQHPGEVRYQVFNGTGASLRDAYVDPDHRCMSSYGSCLLAFDRLVRPPQEGLR